VVRRLVQKEQVSWFEQKLRQRKARALAARQARDRPQRIVAVEAEAREVLAGAVLAMVITYILTLYFHSLSLVDWLIISLIIIIGGTFGDLVESLLKRSIEIKDSGDSLPGHGGFLDRFDGLLISAPFIVAYLEIF
jgi:predicted CDP-diglyceride synthetase/phosphatidate cytidylyltransferase